MSDHRLRSEDYMRDGDAPRPPRRRTLADVVRAMRVDEAELEEYRDLRNADQYQELLERRRREGR